MEKRIVLIGCRWCETRSGTFNFGEAAEAEPEQAGILLSMQNAHSEPLFMPEEELNQYPKVVVKLADPAGYFCFYDRRLYGGETLDLPEPLANHLIRREGFCLA